MLPFEARTDLEAPTELALHPSREGVTSHGDYDVDEIDDEEEDEDDDVEPWQVSKTIARERFR